MRIIDWLDSYLQEKIDKISIFRYLDEDEKKILLKFAHFHEYYKDEKIISQGETSYSFYALISGKLNVTIKGENNNQIQISHINEGEFFGETGIFDNAQRTATVSAAETSQVLVIERNDFFCYIRMYPKAGVKLLMLFVNGLMQKLNASNKELVVEKQTGLGKIPFFEDMA
ncbi:MAG: cyclic nucleotide-binding domain-containing protein [Firmicutes bacterium]|nr:cyclic nucleotide-binding domain-containing protein [Bacillota bacterium]